MTAYPITAFAKGWLAVATASGNDADRPQLHRTILIEEYPTGVRLVATDSYLLLRAWVPNLRNDLAPEPAHGDPPTATAVAIDADGRARNLLAYALRLAAKNDDDTGDYLYEISLRIAVTEVDGDGVLTGLEAEFVVLELADHERVKLRSYEGAFPNWRRLVPATMGKATTQIALGPEIVARLAKMAKVVDGHIGWTFYGPDKPAAVETIDADPVVAGVAMPVRWDMVTNQPAPEPDSDDA